MKFQLTTKSTEAAAICWASLAQAGPTTCEDVIDEARVFKAFQKLNLPPETIRQHYEAIVQEIPLRLSWKE